MWGRNQTSTATIISMCQPFSVTFVVLLLITGNVLAEVEESFELDTYEVDHEPGQTLLEAINAESPIRERGRIFHGHTRWFIRWNYRWREETGGRCRITEVKTTLHVDMTLPELDDATAGARRQFDTYVRLLREHEDGHRRIARDAAHAVDSAILTLRPMASCKLLSRAANQLGQSILQDTRRIERQYDTDTDHGCTQGACL